MVLFQRENLSTEKFDPVTTAMVFIHKKSDIKKVNKFGENVLHYSCKVGATISTLSLINEGADMEKTNSAKNTPFAEALINGHEDLCIFLIQNNSNIKIDVQIFKENKQH